MVGKRTTDPEDQKRYFRSDGRVFRMNEQWYVAIREGDLGPFATQNIAARELTSFIAEQVQLKHFQHARDKQRHLASVTPISKNVWDNRPDSVCDTVARIDISQELFI